MRVTEHLDRATGPLISFEIIPPKRGGNVQTLMSLIDGLVVHRPPFIDITSHAAEIVYQETPQGTEPRIVRKRPGTLGVCALLQNKYNVDAVPHVLCNGFTREETEDFLIELRYLGIDNVLAIRGDDHGYQKPLSHGRSANTYAVDLVRQVQQMNRGEYLQMTADADPTNFCVGVAGYPEKHFESPNLERDVQRTKEKVDAGADYIVTQMFFDNERYFEYVQACRDAGIEVPIIPGLKILTTRAHLTRIPKHFYCEIPNELSGEIEGAKKEHVPDVGVAWAIKQTTDLLERGVPSVHFYVMASAVAVTKVIQGLKL